MTYFNNCQTLDEVKKEYRKLAMQFHPDKGGSTETMQAINDEYNYVTAKILSGGTFTKEQQASEFDMSEQFREVLNKIIALEGINIEICSHWIWVTGNTYPVKNTLKSAGFFFASKKVAWYFRPAEYKVKSKTKMSLDQIRSKYGSQTVGTSYSKSLN
jgi:hypothetical protein